MKIRSDFVTNSSSSSFILAFDNQENMVNDLLNDYSAYGYLERILRDIMELKDSQSVEKIIEEYKEYMESDAEWILRRDLERKKGMSWSEAYDWSKDHAKEFQAQVDKFVQEKVENLKKELKGKELVVMVEYSDNDGESALEHDVVPYLKSCKAVLSNH